MDDLDDIRQKIKRSGSCSEDDRNELIETINKKYSTAKQKLDFAADMFVNACLMEGALEIQQQAIDGKFTDDRVPPEEFIRNAMQVHSFLSFMDGKLSSPKNALDRRPDQLLKPGWLDHCRNVLNAGHEVKTLDDLLNISGYDQDVTKVGSQTLRKWAGEVGIVFKRGRPKQT